MSTPQELGSSNERLGAGRYKDHFVHVGQTIATLADVVSSRLANEGRGVLVQNVPVGGIEAVRRTQGFWDEAREGFRVCFRIGECSVGIDPQRLLAATTLQDVSEILEELGFSQKPQMVRVDRTPFIPAFASIWAPLVVLHQRQRVSLDSLESRRKEEVGPYFSGFETFWTQAFSMEYIWDRINQFAFGVRGAAWRKGSIRNTIERTVIETMHFLDVAEEVNNETFGVWAMPQRVSS